MLHDVNQEGSRVCEPEDLHAGPAVLVASLWFDDLVSHTELVAHCHHEADVVRESTHIAPKCSHLRGPFLAGEVFLFVSVYPVLLQS